MIALLEHLPHPGHFVAGEDWMKDLGFATGEHERRIPACEVRAPVDPPTLAPTEVTR